MYEIENFKNDVKTRRLKINVVVTWSFGSIEMTAILNRKNVID